MNPSQLLVSPLFNILFKWTCLLALGWVAHGFLRHRPARLRLILWRGILCGSLVLPLAQFIEFPGIKIPLDVDDAFSGESVSAHSTDASPKTSPAIPETKLVAAAVQATLPPVVARSLPIPSRRSIPWMRLGVSIWAFGCVWGIFRLTRLNMQLSRLVKHSTPPEASLQHMAKQIQQRLNLRDEVTIRVSATTISPFVCGVLKPAIVLPQKLTRELPPGELSALLSHEIAHLYRHDLFWCVAWRWMKVLCWVHPLVWNIPAVHNLACEQEADRVASGQLMGEASYTQMLARLALRVITLPAVETRLTLNGGSQIVRRLIHLGENRSGAWNWKYSIAGFGLVGILFLLTAGCELSKSASIKPGEVRNTKFDRVLVVVQDEDGKPIEGATILPDGFRVKGPHHADGYHWGTQFGSPPGKALTDHDGKAYVKYPVMGNAGEKLETGALIFSVMHPEYASVRVQDYLIDKSEKPIQLPRGIHLDVTAYHGSDHQPVIDFVPSLNEEVMQPDDWQKKDNGGQAFHRMSPGGHILQLMGRLPTGEIVFSDDIAFTAEAGQEYKYALEMKPGIRVEGRLDDKVPRPVKNGRVVISVRPKEFPAWHKWEEVEQLYKRYAMVRFWKTYRPIAEDGTFVFESVPPGTLDVIVHGDGFVSTGEAIPGFALPQDFPLTMPVTKIEVATERTATLELTAKTRWGNPVVGAKVSVNPNVARMGGILGLLRESSEQPYRTLPPLTNNIYVATTDTNGVAIVRNVPAIERGLEVSDSKYEVPLQDPKHWRDRHLRTTYSPGETNHFVLTMEPIGKSFIGGK